jgi:hypothetical protein
MTYVLYTTLDRALPERAIVPTTRDAMTDMKPEQSAAGRCSQVYLLRLWREAALSPWRLSLRQASEGAAIGFADLDDLVIFLLRAMGRKGGTIQGEEQTTSCIE